MKFRIMVVDDHAIVLHGLKKLINSEKDLVVAMEAESAEAALILLEQERPDLLVADISLPGLSGLELVKKVSQLYPTIPTLVLSMHDELVHGERAFRAGAKGYVVKQEATDKVIVAIRRILDGGVYLSERMQALMVKGGRSASAPKTVSVTATLSDREYEVFRLIGMGLGSSEIAIKLERSVKTVESHRANIKQKLGLRTGHELNRFAVNWTDRERV